MERKLYVAWQAHESRLWYTIGILTHGDATGYEFRYVRGAQKAHDCGFPGISSFPDLDKVYRSESLFSFFSNRIMSSSRPEYKDLIRQVGFRPMESKQSPDYVFGFLAHTHGWRATDAYEMFAPVKKVAGTYCWDFFTRGLRYIEKASETRWAQESPVGELRAVPRPENEFDPTAVSIEDAAGSPLGFVPGNYSATVFELCAHADDVKIEILRHNREEWLDQKRFLLRLTASMPATFQLSHQTELEPLVAADPTPAGPFLDAEEA